MTVEINRTSERKKERVMKEQRKAHILTKAMAGQDTLVPVASRTPAESSADRLLDARLAHMRHIGSTYTPSARAWAEVFRQESGEC